MRSCTELVASNASKTDIRRYSADGDHVSVVLHIHDTLRAAAKEEASLRCMTLSAFLRICIIGKPAKRGA